VSEAPPMTSIEALLDWVLEQLDAAGIADPIVVDLTQEHVGIPVVHVTIPGAEGAIAKDGYTPGPRMHALLANRP